MNDETVGRLAGQRLGPYRLTAVIGSGGMGEVYRAVRADEEYRQEVAIKLVRAGQDLQFTAQRMRAERQILAGFEHPAIARLLDGGTTEDGIPYLVMELVDGRPITTYCDACGLAVRERLGLFLQVCAAVQYAHQRMVIHRDLKPSNILVSADGAPKLLDFGIAKILDPAVAPLPADATINAQRILTPQYASPEQMRGEPVTAASDVYSLGVILHELLTGARPSAPGEKLTQDVLRAVYEPDTKKPSAVVRLRAVTGARASTAGRALELLEGSPERLARRLKGDLDNIVLTALRREPARRYATVEQLARDIGRHLAHRPVAARRPTLAYRAAALLARHRVAVPASAIAALALAAGFATAVWEAHVATVQRARAERRFDQVRRLADTLIFDIHDSIADLPGAERSRRLVIDTALRYLDSLAADAADDPTLERELANGYLRLGDVQGRALEANQGNYAGALASYRRALALLDASRAAQPQNAATVHDLVVACGKLSDLTWNLGRPAEALAYSRRTVVESRKLAASHPRDAGAAFLRARSELDYGYKLFEIRGDPRAEPHLRHAVASLEAQVAAQPANRPLARTLALAYGRMAALRSAGHRDAEALALERKAQPLLRRLIAAAPHGSDYPHLLAHSEDSAAGALTALGRLDAAARDEQAALSGFRRLTAADPSIEEYRVDVGLALSGVAAIALARDEPRAALASLRESLEWMDRGSSAGAARGSAPANASGEFRLVRAQVLERMGEADDRLAAAARADAAQRLRDARGACAAYREAAGLYGALSASWIEAAAGMKKIAPRLASCPVDTASGGAVRARETASVHRAEAVRSQAPPEHRGDRDV
ncbi:MAG: protein kinase domain-containing protein [Steroidobacteraceae bacterium]